MLPDSQPGDGGDSAGPFGFGPEFGPNGLVVTAPVTTRLRCLTIRYTDRVRR